MPLPGAACACGSQRDSMTSSKRSCYVYLQLPGTLNVFTCGRYEREILRDGRAVGRFVYGESYRQRTDAVPLDPYQLPITPRRYETSKLEGLFGALRDASPDAWGRRVIEKVTGQVGLDEFDFLMEGPEDRAGALSFGLARDPPAPARDFNRVLNLAAVSNAAKALENMRSRAPVPQPHLQPP